MALKKDDCTIPHHVLVKYLGSGALGEVWLVRGPGGVHKAAKFIRLELRHGVKELLAIQRIKQIHHPHLVQVTDVWLLDDDNNVIPDEAMDQVSARLSNTASKSPRSTLAPDTQLPHTLVVAMTLADKNLFDRLKECQDEGLTGIPYVELIRYMQEAAKGIDFLNQPHEVLGGKSIQHCDIKPQNLLLVGGSVQLCDFGLVRLVGERKTTNQLEGTLAYIAPEAARGQQPTPTTDQYSLAISYYELRTGLVPFDENSSVYEIIDVHTTGKLDYSLLNQAEQKVLQRATSLDPTKRYPSNRDFVDALIEANAPRIAAQSKWVRWAMGISALLVFAMMSVALLLMPKFAKTQAPLVELPAQFAAMDGAEMLEINNRVYPNRIIRRFADGDEVVFLLIHEPSKEQLFYIMENKVWNGLFRKYIEAKGEGTTNSGWQRGGIDLEGDVGADDPRLPVLHVTVDEAYDFASWLGGEQKGRLPSIAQWDTASGLYRPNRTNSGPYLEPFGEDDIAVNRAAKGPMRIGEASKDISPFGVRDMAGNGSEFTRTLVGGRDEVPLANAKASDGILRRGRSYAWAGEPLKYQDLEDSEKDIPWIYVAPSAETGFRVVIERLTAP